MSNYAVLIIVNKIFDVGFMWDNKNGTLNIETYRDWGYSEPVLQTFMCNH